MPQLLPAATAADPSVVGVVDYEALIKALRFENYCQKGELLVTREMTKSLGNALLVTEDTCSAQQQKLAQVEQQLAALRAKCAQQDVDSAQVHRVPQLEAKVAVLESAIQQHHDESQPLLEEVTQLRVHRTNLEAQMTEWKDKVKEALKEGKRREQQLMSSEILLKTELKQLKDKLDQTTFELQASAALAARPRSDKEVQTDPVLVGNVNGGSGAVSNAVNVQSGLAAPDALMRRRRSVLSRERGASLQAASPPTTLTMSMDGRVLSGSPPAFNPPPPFSPANGANGTVDGSPHPHATVVVPPNGTQVPPVSPMVLPLRAVSIDPSQNLALSFPLPLSPLVISSAGSTTGAPPESPMRIDAASAPEPAPFMVTVHCNTSEGWSIQSKHRVPRGMTVADLTEQCCEQFRTRYQQSHMDPDSMCLRMNHERAKRSVVLSPGRELHSFAVLLRCQSENVNITLFLTPRDEMAEYVQSRIRARRVEDAAA